MLAAFWKGTRVKVAMFRCRRQSDAKLSAQDIMKAIQTREVDFKREYWEGVSEEAREFVSQLLVKDAGDRPLAAEALEHPWLKEADQRATTQPLDGSVIRRLQRYATAGLLKRSILRVLVEHVPDAVAKEVTEFQVRLSMRVFGSAECECTGAQVMTAPRACSTPLTKGSAELSR